MDTGNMKLEVDASIELQSRISSKKHEPNSTHIVANAHFLFLERNLDYEPPEGESCARPAMVDVDLLA